MAHGAPYGNRTRVSAVKGRRPGPLDEGREKGAGAAGHIKSFGQAGKQEPFRGMRVTPAVEFMMRPCHLRTHWAHGSLKIMLSSSGKAPPDGHPIDTIEV